MGVTMLVERLRLRLRSVDALRALVAAAIVLAGTTASGLLMGGAAARGAVAGLTLGAAIVAAGLRRSWRSWTPATVARLVEARVPGLDNLLITAVELSAAPGRATARMQVEVARQAAERATGLVPASIVPLGRPLAMMAVAAACAGAVVGMALRTAGPGEVRDAAAGGPTGFTRLQAVVTPPPYLGEPPQTVDDPAELTVRAGSLLRLDVGATTGMVWVQEAGADARALHRDASGLFTVQWSPGATTTLVVATGDSAGVATDTRLLPVVVVPDLPPRVRIAAPGRDLAFGSAAHVVKVQVEAEDADGVSALDLRFTRLSGSGETFTFSEGRVPLEVERQDHRRWTAHATWSLAPLGLGDGDAIVYRAVAKDVNPVSDWASSESYTVEIGRRLEIASAGFALPDEDRRYAISQQMVIVETERLQAQRAGHAAAEWGEQTALLAMEQRMVRSEVVFLSGGEVQDEVEEAAQADELQEGRLENRGRAEMLRAITQMSRAEARLMAGDTAGALVFERTALEAMQRAFDRRRYFLRTLPERARIDLSRRLSGDRRQAGSFARPPTRTDGDTLAAERAVMAELAPVAETGAAATPTLVANFASLDLQSPDWRAVAAALASADSAETRRAAALDAMNRVAARALGSLAPQVSGLLAEPPGALRGWWAEESRARRQR